MIDDVLLRAYATTSYWIDVPGAPFYVQIGQVSAELDALLDAHQVEEWTYITAYNPRSAQIDMAINEQRQCELTQEVMQAGYTIIQGRGVGQDESWPPEPSLLLLGIPRHAAVELGRKYEQNAIVVGQKSKAPELVLCI